jgi:hypothetical protein
VSFISFGSSTEGIGRAFRRVQFSTFAIVSERYRTRWQRGGWLPNVPDKESALRFQRIRSQARRSYRAVCEWVPLKARKWQGLTAALITNSTFNSPITGAYHVDIHPSNMKLGINFSRPHGAS